MKPLKNTNDQSGCDPVSSNCVIWQGPDIPCIDLCHGDSVSDVVAKLANELCTVLNTLDVKTYDLSCFTPACPEFTSFEQIIQFILDQICELQTCCNAESESTAGCPGCVLNIATCFQYVDQFGDTISTMNIDDYVRAIGNKVCEIESSLSTLSSTVADHESRITNIEDTCCDNAEAQSVTVDGGDCIFPGDSNIPIQNYLDEFESAFCNLQSGTGSYQDIISTGPLCFPDTQGVPTSLDPNNNGAPIEGYNLGINGTLAGSLSNAWAVICDLYETVRQLQDCCSGAAALGCDDISVTLNSVQLGNSGVTLDLNFGGNIPSGWAVCAEGSYYEITDAFGVTLEQPISAGDFQIGDVNLSVPSGLQPSVSHAVSVVICFTDGTQTCSKQFQTQTISGTVSCNSVALSVVDTASGNGGFAQASFNLPLGVFGIINYQVVLAGTSGVCYSTSGSGTQGQAITATNTTEFCTTPAGSNLSCTESVTATVYISFGSGASMQTITCEATTPVVYTDPGP